MRSSAIVSRIAHEASVTGPRERMGTAWWRELEPDFARRPEPFRLATRDALQVRAGAATDILIRTVGACLVGGLALPLGYHPLRMRSALADREFYGPLAESGDPARFFEPPPRGVRVVTSGAARPLFRPADGDCVDVWFESPYVPANPRERAPYLRHRDNRRAHARWWRHHQGPRPTIVAIHGFSADLYHLNEFFFALPWLYQLGFDVLLFTMPFHGRRQTRFSPFSGHGFFAGGPSRINEAFGQTVFDFRILLDHLIEERGVPRVGVTGVSIGGFTAALLASIEPRLSFASANVPLVSIPDLALEWEPIATVIRASLAGFGVSIEQARHLLAVSSPLTYEPLLPRERLLVIGGVGDRLAPPKHSRLLWEHWDRCGLYWFPGSHLFHLDRGEYLRQTARFLGRIGFFEGLPRRPRRPRLTGIRRLLGR